MSPERWTQIERILDAVLDVEPNQRSVVIQKTCGDNEELRREVEKYLRHIPKVETFLQESAKDLVVEQLSGDGYFNSDWIKELERIDRYRIVQEIGHGGMGRVYLAERADGEYTQRVALKLLHSFLDSVNMQNRLRVERQILASLNHPNIARLLDGGMVDIKNDRRYRHPYIVMEYVEGKSIKDYCNENRLTIPERLKLFLKAAEAVRHAHRNLVVHCDIKPSNILVTEDGDVKLLDFGIARLLNPDASIAGDYSTRTVRNWMTPEYAAPEQIKGERATTSTDIYQLGVLLYVLLTDHHPFGRIGENLHKLEQAILESDPAKPSAIAEDTAVSNKLRGDLDAIILKALRKEPEARYESTASLVEDIKRYLSGLPVLARRGNFPYHAGKFVRRHRLGVASTVLIFVLTGSLTGYYTQRVAVERDRAEQEALNAQIEAGTAEQVAEFLLGMFQAGSPDEAPGEEITALDLIEQGVARAEELDGQPEIQARMFHVMGRVYMQLGQYDNAYPLLERALAIHEFLYDDDDEQVASSLNMLASLLQNRGEYKAAEQMFRRSLTIRQNLFGDRDERVATSLNNLGLVLVLQGKYDEAEPLYKESLSITRELPETGPEQIAMKLNNIAGIHYEKGEHEKAEPLYRESLELNMQVYGENHRRTAMAMDNLAKVLLSMEQYYEAGELMQKSLSVFRNIVGDDHPDVGHSHYSLATLYERQGDLDSAEAHFRIALSIDEKVLGKTHPDIAYDLIGLGRVHLALGDPLNAEPLFRRALEIRRNSLPSGDWRIAESLILLGQTFVDTGRYDEAEQHMIEGYLLFNSSLGKHSQWTRRALERVVELYDLWGYAERADQYRKMLAESMQ